MRVKRRSRRRYSHPIREGEPEVVADGGLETIPVERLRLSQVVWFVEFDGELRTSVGTVRDYEIEFSMQAISELLIRQPRAVESERWQVALRADAEPTAVGRVRERGVGAYFPLIEQERASASRRGPARSTTLRRVLDPGRRSDRRTVRNRRGHCSSQVTRPSRNSAACASRDG